ncbi:DUF2474 domain-containing protein [Azorhizobium caulinodans]|uniref:DUF2474 domain-containing protein n=1 Tax=Azorhizobium caulinodans (strain ATCC 43989 / DSM 5975 / JCM 20966 / LMG 6465 / NBRC 14845 / NCIMB 13405 / ORS 571) TaxID=438753 RepID=A8INK3_AZOC5|nr:uncharacterized protein DUF2474 [Azorhizobium sp. AG788]BAF89759.1 hypothetical protein AZC_3761 [Azorhizobium caulinodans ORS 571]
MSKDTAPSNRTEGRSRGNVWVRRLGWLILIWSLSVAALGAAALLFRLLMKSAGMTP